MKKLIALILLSCATLAGCSRTDSTSKTDSVEAAFAHGAATSTQPSTTNQKASDLPIWELPEVKNSIPVLAPHTHDGLYDYSVPGFQRADLCSLPIEEYLESKGLHITSKVLSFDKDFSECSIEKIGKPSSIKTGLGTDQHIIETKMLNGTTDNGLYVGQVKPDGDRFTQCGKTVETPVGRVTFSAFVPQSSGETSDPCIYAEELFLLLRGN